MILYFPKSLVSADVPAFALYTQVCLDYEKHFPGSTLANDENSSSRVFFIVSAPSKMSFVASYIIASNKENTIARSELY